MPLHQPGAPPTDLPDALAALADGLAWTGVPTWSPSEVWRLDPAGTDPLGPPCPDRSLFLKVVLAREPDHSEHRREIDLLCWLTDPLAPSVAGHGTLPDGRGWLVTRALPGADARHPAHRAGSVEVLLESLGRTATAVHAHPTDGCPVVATVAGALDRAERRVAAGLVDQPDFATAFRRYTPRELLDRIRAMAPPEPEHLVLIHGDLSVANTVLEPGGSGPGALVDWGRGGLGDPARDLALLTRSVSRHIGPEAAVRVLDTYEGPRPDPARLDFWALLDELQ